LTYLVKLTWNQHCLYILLCITRNHC